jgi:hypothetical protein
LSHHSSVKLDAFVKKGFFSGNSVVMIETSSQGDVLRGLIWIAHGQELDGLSAEFCCFHEQLAILGDET